ncbi:peptide chain release factor 1 [Candidatus Parcubacteria bacterium]|nr:peptide chain release factor 1 [Candidatus Parcubacteria bacterium]
MPSVSELKKEYQEILNKLSDPELISDWEKFEELSKRKTSLEKTIEKEKEIEDIKNQIEENRAILSANEDAEFSSLAQEELNSLLIKQKNMETELEKELNPEESVEEVSPEKQNNTIIMEIRAGTGGDEAALFAANLYRMYSRYAQIKGWKEKVLNSSRNEIGGTKEISFEIKGDDVFASLKYEGGVHRVQRIPETEKNGRIHTSTATVAIMLRPKKTEIKISSADLRIDIFRSSGPGGQNVNKRETAIRITHLPTGMVVASQTARNQLANKENAMAILEARLLEKKRTEEEEKSAGNRKAQVGWGTRSEKIRTYNFPQDRITDHRIKKNWHNIEKIMAGEMDQIVTSLKKGLAE